MKRLYFFLLSLCLISSALAQNTTPPLKVEVSGAGAPLLLIPGLGCSGEVWQSTVAALEKNYQCHVLTLPGFAGQASLPEKEKYLQQVERQIMDYLDAKQLRQVGLIGHSLGGFLSLKLAAAQPQRFNTLFIVDALPFLAAMQMPGATPETVKPMAQSMQRNMMQQPQEAREAMQRSVLRTMVNEQADLEKILQWNLASDKAVLAQAMYELYVTDIREEIASIKAPVRVLGAWVAYKDYGVTHELSLRGYQAQYAKLPQAKVVLTDKGKHFIMYDDPAFYFAQLKEMFPY